MIKKYDLSVVICNYNTRKLLSNTLNSIKKNIGNLRFEIIVVDDNSSDGSAEMVKRKYPFVMLLQNKHNLGYSKSYNVGTRKARGRYILHLNSDITFLTQKKLDSLVKYLDENPQVGIVGCKLVKLDGQLDPPCKRSFPNLRNVFFQSIGLAALFPKNKLFGNYYLSYLDADQVHEVDCLMGAFMLIRKQVLKEIGLLDERFFIYGEDIDFCYRAKLAGWKIVYNPTIALRHHHGGTTGNARIKHVVRFHSAMFLYYRKNYWGRHNPIVNSIVIAGIGLRMTSLIVFNYLRSFGVKPKYLPRQAKN